MITYFHEKNSSSVYFVENLSTNDLNKHQVFSSNNDDCIDDTDDSDDYSNYDDDDDNDNYTHTYPC